MSKKKFDVFAIYPLSKALNQTWFVKYRLSGLATGKLMKAQVPSLKTVAEREVAAKKIVADLEKSGWKPAEKPNFKSKSIYVSQGFDLVASRKGSLSEKSISTMQSHFRQLNEFCLKRGTSAITPAVAAEFLDSKMAEGRHPKTVNNYRATFNANFGILVDRKVIRRDPFKDTEKKKGDSDCPNWFKEHEFNRLEAYLKKEKAFLWSAARWVFYCLMRPTSTLRLVKIGDIDFTRWLVKLKHSNTKNSKSYWVTIPDELRAEIEPLNLFEYPPSYYLVGLNGLPAKEMVGKNYWNRHFKQVLEVLEFNSEGYYFYCFKHTGFAHAYLNGVGMLELMKHAGHQDIKETYKYMRRLGLEDFPDLKLKFRKLNTKK